jgi:polyhydroxyalkanoate synthase
MPVLVLAAEKDHITPPEFVTAFFEKIPSKDKSCFCLTKGISV